jgi:hypothetical protein
VTSQSDEAMAMYWEIIKQLPKGFDVGRLMAEFTDMEGRLARFFNASSAATGPRSVLPQARPAQVQPPVSKSKVQLSESEAPLQTPGFLDSRNGMKESLFFSQPSQEQPSSLMVHLGVQHSAAPQIRLSQPTSSQSKTAPRPKPLLLENQL